MVEEPCEIIFAKNNLLPLLCFEGSKSRPGCLENCPSQERLRNLNLHEMVFVEAA
jgi:hypothetical protein